MSQSIPHADSAGLARLQGLTPAVRALLGKSAAAVEASLQADHFSEREHEADAIAQAMATMWKEFRGVPARIANHWRIFTVGIRGLGVDRPAQELAATRELELSLDDYEVAYGSAKDATWPTLRRLAVDEIAGILRSGARVTLGEDGLLGWSDGLMSAKVTAQVRGSTAGLLHRLDGGSVRAAISDAMVQATGQSSAPAARGSLRCPADGPVAA